jgi:hypothetical protein
MSDLIFFAGGECLERFGTLVWRQSAAQDVSETHTRSGTVGPTVTKNGKLVDSDANVPRVDWLSDEAYLLLEDARTNLVTSDDVSTWTNNATGMSVTSSIADPAGGTGAYDIVGDGTVSSQGKYTSVGFTGDAVKSALFVVKEDTMPASGNQSLTVYDQTATVFRLKLDITGWSSGEPTITEAVGTHLGSRYIGNGYWAVYGQTTSVTAANTHLLIIYSNISASAGTITVYRANAFDDVVPSHSILDASETRNADTFYADFPHKPQAMTVYAKFIERGAIADSTGVDVRVVCIGSSASGGDPRFQVYANAGKIYKCVHDNGTAAPIAGTTSTLSAPSMGDTVELRAVLNTDGSVTIGQSINAGTEATATDTTAATLGSAWAGQRIYLNSVGGTAIGTNQFRAVKVARGVQTMRGMRNL